VEIKNEIIEMIKDGTYKYGEKIPTENELMAHYKVSKVTITKALQELVRLGWIRRIQGRGSFVDKQISEISSLPSLKSPALSDKDRPTLGLVIPAINDAYSCELVNSIAETCEREGFSLLSKVRVTSVQQEEADVRELITHGVKGIMIMPQDSDTYNNEILAMKVNGFPFVLLDRKLYGVQTNWVMSDNRLGSKMAVEHLFKLGHHRIAYVMESAICMESSSQVRWDSYCEQMQNLGCIPVKSPYLLCGHSSQPLHEIIENQPLLEAMRKRKYSAYLANNSLTAIRLYKLAKFIGLQIPRDISLMCFDSPSDKELKEFAYIDQNSSVMGKRAVEILVNAINNGTSKDSYTTELITPFLVEGMSAGKLSDNMF